MSNLTLLLSKLELQGTSSQDSYSVTAIPGINRHKIGLTQLACPIFFIHCNVPSKTTGLDYNLEMVSVRFNKQCTFKMTDGSIQEDYFTIFELKSGFAELERYFLQIVELMLSNLPKKLSLTVLRGEIDQIINLFNRLSRPAIKSIQGLWAELFIIERSKDPSYLVRSWHINERDRFDFNDGIQKLEVKSTSMGIRKHTFSAEQLNLVSGGDLLIASVTVIQTGIGFNIFDLVNIIDNRMENNLDRLKLHEMIAITLGRDLASADVLFYDHAYAIAQLAFFDISDLPNISLKTIPMEISNIHFDLNLTSVKQKKAKNLKGKLHGTF